MILSRQDDQFVRVDQLGESACCQILLDDSAGALQVVCLIQHGDSATATGDDYLVRICQRADGVDLYNVDRLRCCHDPSIAALHLCDMISFFLLCVCILPVHDTSDDLGGLVECLIVRVYGHLGQDRCHRFVDASVQELRADRVLQIVADVALAHGGAHAHGCGCIFRI